MKKQGGGSKGKGSRTLVVEGKPRTAAREPLRSSTPAPLRTHETPKKKESPASAAPKKSELHPQSFVISTGSKESKLADAARDTSGLVRREEGGVHTAEASVNEVTTLVHTRAAQVVTLKVIDNVSLGIANALLVEFAGAKKLIEERRKFFLGPLKESLKRLEAQFKEPQQKLLDADRELRNKVTAFIEARKVSVEQTRTELVKEANAAEQAGDSDKALALAVQSVALTAGPRVMPVAGSQVATSQVTDFEIVDYGQVPQEYFTIDEAKIRAAIRSGRTDIPGVRIFKKAQLVVGGVR